VIVEHLSVVELLLGGLWVVPYVLFSVCLTLFSHLQVAIHLDAFLAALVVLEVLFIHQLTVDEVGPQDFLF